jgi:cysteine synthase A
MFEDRTKLYLGLSFVAGILITLGFKDVYPDLERRYHQRRRRFSTTLNPGASAKVGQKVALKDNTDHPTSLLPDVEIPEGIEGCIGNTPLFKIKSLSDATGCEILAKAEVSYPANIFFSLNCRSNISSFSMAPEIVQKTE